MTPGNGAVPRATTGRTVSENPRFPGFAPGNGGGIQLWTRPGKSILGHPRASLGRVFHGPSPGGGHKPPEGGRTVVNPVPGGENIWRINSPGRVPG